jgi:hypothetical protein
MNINGASGVGVSIDGTQVPDGTVGPNFTVTLNGNGTTGIWARVYDAIFTNLHTPSYGGYEGFAQPSTITMDGPTVTGLNAAYGLRASDGSTITATNGSITTNNGTRGAALYVDGSGGDQSLSTYEDPADQNFPKGGQIYLTDSVVSAIGGTVGIQASYGTAAAPDVVAMSGGSLITDHTTAIKADSAFLDANFSTGAVVTGGGGTLVQVRGDAVGFDNILGNPFLQNNTRSVVNVTADTNSKLNGDAYVYNDATAGDPASILDITLRTGAHWTGASIADGTSVGATNVTLDSSPGLWTMNANSNVTQTVTNAGKIEYTVPTVVNPTNLTDYKTLTTHDYVGQSGTISLNTYLGDDSAPSDRLVIRGGTATGTTTLHIANTIGPGAPTTAKGILVVEVQNDGTTDGTTVPGAFTLDGGSVSSGGYTYTLYRNADQQWYLINNQKRDDGGGGGGGPAAAPTLSPTQLPVLALLLAGMAAAALRRRAR